MLTLSEEIFLLSLYERKSSLTFSPSSGLPYALGGAMLVELIWSGKIRLDESKRIKLADDAPLESELLNEVLVKVRDDDHPRKLKFWITALGSKSKRLQNGYASSLAVKGVLAEDGERYSWVIPCAEYPGENASAKFTRKQHLRAMVLGDEKLDAQSAALLILIKACGLLYHLFTSDEIKLANQRIARLDQSDALDPTLFEVIAEVAAETASVAMSVAAV